MLTYLQFFWLGFCFCGVFNPKRRLYAYYMDKGRNTASETRGFLIADAVSAGLLTVYAKYLIG